MKDIYLTRLFVPRADNAGAVFPRRRVAIEWELLARYHGLTMWGKVQGQWISPSGQIHADSHHVYEIAHAGRDASWWCRFKRKLKRELRQEDVWIIQSTSGWQVV